jgi:prepilin-type N-terminal cleavage/methylation domain-containing protein
MLRNIVSKEKIRGFSLIEIIVGLGIFSIILSSIAVTNVDSLRAISNAQSKSEAYMQLQELTSMVINIKSNSWIDIISNSDGNPYHITLNAGIPEITSGTNVVNSVTSWFEITDLYRDSNGDIVETGGILDPYSRTVTLYMQWTDPLGQENYLVKEMYINDWNTARWTVTTTAEFTPGTFADTVIADIGDGAVGLATLLYPDWCNPQLTMTAHDIPGSGEARTVFVVDQNAYMGTGANASGLAFSHVSITGVDTPVVTTEGTYNEGKVNDIYVDPSTDYAYLATDTSASEVVILDLTSTPYVEIGYFDADGPQDGDAVAYANNVGYVARGSELTSFDLTGKTGSRGEYDTLSISVNGDISDIEVVGDYAYLSVQNASVQLVIVDVSNPSSLVETGSGSANGYDANSIFVRNDGNRAYIGTASNGAGEFFVLDTTLKTGSWPILGQFDTNGMTVTGITTVADGDLAIIVGTGGYEYQVLDITNEASISQCAQIDFPYDVYDIGSAEDSEGNVFSYAVTGDTAQEFRIVRGGQGGGWGSGYGYAMEGYYTSSIYDTGSSDTVYYYLNWLETNTAATDLQVQLRSSDDPAMSGATWMGPDGTSNTWFTDYNGGFTPAGLNFKRYVQFRAILTGDSVDSPVLEEVSILYQN